jgi:hypothetical protein
MFDPKYYTLINKKYDPKEDIRMVRKKIRDWTNDIDMLNEEQYNKILENITNHIDDTVFPVVEMEYYAETLQGWKLVTYRNKLEKEYPRVFKQVILEEKKEIRETIKMMKEDDKYRW